MTSVTMEDAYSEACLQLGRSQVRAALLERELDEKEAAESKPAVVAEEKTEQPPSET